MLCNYILYISALFLKGNTILFQKLLITCIFKNNETCFLSRLTLEKKSIFFCTPDKGKQDISLSYNVGFLIKPE